MATMLDTCVPSRLRRSKNCLFLAALLLASLLLVELTYSSHVLDVKPRGACVEQPKHVHIAPGRDASTSVIVSFATGSSSRGEPDVGQVLLGTSPKKLTKVVEEQEFPIAYNCTSHKPKKVAHYYSPYQHHFEITGLKPATMYYYKVQALPRKPTNRIRNKQQQQNKKSFAETVVFSKQQEDEDEETDSEGGHDRRLDMEERASQSKRVGSECSEVDRVYSFKTAHASPASKDSDVVPVTFAILGDLGQFRHSVETVEHVKNHASEYDAAILVGDLAYTDYDQRKWDTFMVMLEEHSPFANMALAIAAGNHDIEKQTNQSEIFEAYEMRFRMPRVKAPKLGVFHGPLGRFELNSPPYPLPYEYGNSYYSFVFGPSVHIVLNSYSAMEPDSEQYKWFEDTLRNVNRDKTPWVLVTIHTPIYNTYAKHTLDRQIPAAREHIEPLLIRHFVNMVFTGHVHAYQRTHNVAQGERHLRAPMHVTVGAGGRECRAPYKAQVQEDWLVTRDASFYGYGSFHIYNRTHAHWKWLPLSQSDDRDFNIVKDQPDLHLPALHADEAILENQFYLID